MNKLASILLLMLFGIVAVHAQGIKQYSGYFALPHFNIEGKAIYSYKDASDGTRIFHGPFKFRRSADELDLVSAKNSQSDYSGYREREIQKIKDKIREKSAYGYLFSSKHVLTQIEGCHEILLQLGAAVEGRFEENKQVGIWTWTFFNLIDAKKLCTVTITFNEEGVPEGPASYKAYDMEDNYSLIFENGELSSDPIHFVDTRYDGKLWGSLMNGHLVGKYKFAEWRDSGYDGSTLRSITEGEYDTEGNPIGQWIMTSYPEQQRVYANFDNRGNYLGSYYVDESTGDKIDSSFRPYKVEFPSWLYRYREQFLMRSSKIRGCGTKKEAITAPQISRLRDNEETTPNELPVYRGKINSASFGR